MTSTTAKKFNCPSCAAPLEVRAATAATMECSYCGQMVILPRELRAEPQPAPTANTRQPVRPQTWYEQQRAQGKGLGYFVLTLVVVVLAGFAMREAIPRWLGNLSGAPAIANVIPAGPARVEKKFGGAGTGAGLFTEPKHIAVDANGFVSVIDKTLRVQRFRADGTFHSGWQMNEKDAHDADFIPRRMAADRAGNVYVMSALSLRQYDGANGQLRKTFQPGGVAQMYTAFALLPDGGMVVLMQDLSTDALVWYDASGNATKRVDKPISTQTGKIVAFGLWDDIAADGLGNLFVLHSEPSQETFVYKFTRDGKYISRFGGKGDKPGQFQFARRLGVDDASRVYVLDQRYIQRFDAEGRFLDWLPVTVTGNYAQDFALAGKNVMYAAGADSHVYELLWSKPE